MHYSLRVLSADLFPVYNFFVGKEPMIIHISYTAEDV